MDLTKGLRFGWPDAEWVLDGDSYDGLTWLSESKKPTEDDIVKAVRQAEKQELEQHNALVAARQSALNKLKSLGLTEQEAKTIAGQ